MITLISLLPGVVMGEALSGMSRRNVFDRSLLSELGSLYDQPGGIGDLVGGPSGSLITPKEEESSWSLLKGEYSLCSLGVGGRYSNDGNIGTKAGC